MFICGCSYFIIFIILYLLYYLIEETRFFMEENTEKHGRKYGIYGRKHGKIWKLVRKIMRKNTVEYGKKYGNGKVIKI